MRRPQVTGQCDQPSTPALQLSLGVVNGLLSDMRPRPATSCSCHPHESVIQPLRLGLLDWLRIPPYTHLHKHHPPPTASIVADANCSNWAHESEHWSERLTICIITSSPSNERFNSRVAVSIAPKIATGEAHAIPKAGFRWSGPLEGAAGGSPAHLSGASRRSGRTLVDLLTK
jgi:hypothetical protein